MTHLQSFIFFASGLFLQLAFFVYAAWIYRTWKNDRPMWFKKLAKGMILNVAGALSGIIFAISFSDQVYLVAQISILLFSLFFIKKHGFTKDTDK